MYSAYIKSIFYFIFLSKIHKSVWSSRCSSAQEDVKTIPFLLYVVNHHTWVQAIQTSFLSNLKCSNHRNNRTCKSMRNSHSGGCETKRAQNSLAISKPCLCERACVSITMNPIHYTLWIITVQHAQTQHSLPTYYMLKCITNASENTCAQALTCISNEVTLCCKNVGGALTVICAV